MLDTLDTLIAFVTVVLVLSLLVTGLVQLLQYAFQFRGRNLELGLAGLIASLLDSKAPRKGGPAAGATAQAARRIAGAVIHDPLLNQPSNGALNRGLSRGLARLSRVPVVGKPADWLHGMIVGRTTWIEKDELKASLRRVLADEAIASHEAELGPERGSELTWGLDDVFERWERNLSKRFQHRMRWVTTVSAIVVVVLFQVDGFSLLRDLSVDAELRNRIAGLSGEVLEREAGVREMLDLRGAAEEALERLEARHPEVEALLEEASGVGPDRASIVAELEGLLADRPARERDAILAEYRELLDGVIVERQKRAKAVIDDALALSARMGLEPWRGGLDFYLPIRFGRWLGVAVMVFLVSFGAPFWFNQLRNLVALRDLLKPVKKEGARAADGGA